MADAETRRRGATVLLLAILLAGVFAAAALLSSKDDSAVNARRPLTTAIPPSTTAPAPPLRGLDRPHSLAVDRDGNLLIADQGTSRIVRRHSDGSLEVLAGNGQHGYSGDGGPAVAATLGMPFGLAVAGDGTIYFADASNNRVRAILPNGTISLVAGSGAPGSRGDGGPAIEAELTNPIAVAVAPDETLYIAEGEGVRRVASNGTIDTVVTGGAGALDLPGGPTYLGPTAVAVDGAGSIYVANFSPKQLVQFSSTGELLQVWENVYVAGGGLVGTDDGVVIANYGFSIDRVRDGVLATLLPTASRDRIPGGHALRPMGIAIGRDGEIYTADDGASGASAVPLLLVLDRDRQVRLLGTR